MKQNVLEIKGKQHLERDVLDSEIPVIVDFWAPWCQPCKQQGPVVDAVAKDFDGQVRFAKVNTEKAQSLAAAFNISSIPSLLVFDRGEIIDVRIGLTSRVQLREMAQRALDRHNGVGLIAKIKRFFGGESKIAPTVA